MTKMSMLLASSILLPVASMKELEFRSKLSVAPPVSFTKKTRIKRKVKK